VLDPGDGVVAVGAGAGGEHDAGHFCGAGGFEDVERAGGVDFVIEDGLFDGARDAAEGGLVEDESAASGGAGEEGFVEDGAVDKFEGEAGEVVGGAAGKVVEDDDLCAEGAEGLGEVGADEAGAAGDEDAG
jgi:hypothetical protein